MKMEGIELYPHNQKAYDNLCAMLRDNNRACVVQPTGTGKFVIIAKMAQDNPGKNFLLLGTNDYMYIDQMANLSDIAPGFTPKNLQFMTYATAMAKARCGDEIPRCDVIVADEFHHCGAPEWGKGVQYVVENNPDAKIVGLSATPIRYSDKGRNMADEMFIGNLANSMELEEAWLDGVLPMPKYVIALYDAPKELGELKVSIEKVREKKKYSKFVKKYEELRRCCKNPYRTFDGKHWCYPDDLESRIDNAEEYAVPRKTAVQCLETGKMYESIADASRDTGINHNSIGAVARGDRHKAGGYTWEYVNPAPDKRDNRGCNQPTAKKVRCAETGNQFVSLSDAARAVGLRNGNSIRRAIDRGGTAGGYHWEYLDEKKEVSTDHHHQADGRAE